MLEFARGTFGSGCGPVRFSVPEEAGARGVEASETLKIIQASDMHPLASQESQDSA